MTQPASPDARPDGHPRADPLGRLLDAFAPPALPAGFADTVLARAAARQDLPAPAARRRGFASRLWRTSPRVVIGLAGAGLMTAAAAATTAGVFGDLGVTIPAWQKVVSRVTGAAPAAAHRPTAPVARGEAADAPAPAPSLRDVLADGKISGRAELETAFKAMDDRRSERQAANRQRIETSVQRILDQRRARGLPVPSDAEIAAMRARIDAGVAQRQQAIAARREAQRDALRARVDAGEDLSVDALEAQRRAAIGAAAETFRQRAQARRRLMESLTPDQRRRLRGMPARDLAQPPAPQAAPQAGEPADAAPSGADAIAPLPVVSPRQ